MSAYGHHDRDAAAADAFDTADCELDFRAHVAREDGEQDALGGGGEGFAGGAKGGDEVKESEGVGMFSMIMISSPAGGALMWLFWEFIVERYIDMSKCSR